MRHSPLNAALVANEQNAAKARMFKATVHVFSPALYFSFKLLGLSKSRFGYFCGLGLLFQKPIYVLKVSSVTLSVQRSLLVLLARFLRRCMFQVVSVTRALNLRLIFVFQST